MTYKDNTPTFNTGNRNLVNFKDFIQNVSQEEQELKDIKRSFRKNELDKGNKEHKLKYSKVTHKIEDLVDTEVDDKLEVFEKSRTDFDLRDMEEKMSKLPNNGRIKLLWDWIKKDKIDLRQFTKLVKLIDK